MQYTDQDKDKFVQIKQETDNTKAGQKRGRKVQKFSEYCEQTSQRIKELKQQLLSPNATEAEKGRLRN